VVQINIVRIGPSEFITEMVVNSHKFIRVVC